MVRRYLVGSDQQWIFEPPPSDWVLPKIQKTSLYLHVPFCNNFCPYCPYTKVPYDPKLIQPYTQAALSEIDWWADAIGASEITSIYIGGGTPTLALTAVATILDHIKYRFLLTGDICIETNPADVDEVTVKSLHDANISLVSLGIQSFDPHILQTIGRRYDPAQAEHALRLLVESDFSSINADIMFALPGQSTESLINDLRTAERLGADQLTTYPLFTFPYTTVGEFMHLSAVKMPNLRIRRAQYHAISSWCAENDFRRVSVWGFKRGTVPRYSSVTRDGYIGIGPGAGSHLPNEFVFNTFDFDSWIKATSDQMTTVSLRMPFRGEMAGWWWLYWRLYDTRIPFDEIDAHLGADSDKVRLWLRVMKKIKLAAFNGEYFDLTESGSFWLHLLQNYFALNYVNTLWTESKRTVWPESIAI